MREKQGLKERNWASNEEREKADRRVNVKGECGLVREDGEDEGGRG